MVLPIVSLLVLALAVSFDGFGVGVVYGGRKIRIPLLSVIIIACCSGLAMYIAMLLGAALSPMISSRAADWLGAGILIAVGLWAVVQTLMQRSEERPPLATSVCSEPLDADSLPDTARKEILGEARRVVLIEIKRWGLMIEILRTPAKADVDRSGAISATEAVMLGMALSFDAFGAGIGAALLGFSPLATSLLIAGASASFIWLGLHVGQWLSRFRWVQKLTIVPGMVLMAIGLMKLF